MKTKYIFVVGGVLSGVGKGVAAASIGRILKNRGLNVSAIKIDPYINIDAGTMNPTEHGEVFVTEDADETDQDLGNYKVTINSLDDIIINSKNEKLSDVLDSLNSNIATLVTSNLAILKTNLSTARDSIITNIANNNTSISTLNTKLNNSVSSMNSNISLNMPMYSVIAYNGTIAPTGWQLCNGGRLLNTSGDSSGINTPDLRGRFILGAGSGINLTERVIGNIGGEENTALNINQMPSHDHNLRLGFINYANGGTDQRNTIMYQNSVDPIFYHHLNHTNGAGITTTGGNRSHNNMPPFYSLTYIIKQPIQE